MDSYLGRNLTRLQFPNQGKHSADQPRWASSIESILLFDSEETRVAMPDIRYSQYICIQSEINLFGRAGQCSQEEEIYVQGVLMLHHQHVQVTPQRVKNRCQSFP